MTKEQQTAWFVKQQDVPAGMKRKFDSLGYTEQDVQKSYRKEEDVDRFVLWHVFKREGTACGRQEADLEKEFQGKCEDLRKQIMSYQNQFR